MPGAFSPSIAPGLATMRDHLAPVIEHDVGEESFIPAQQAAAQQGTGELHAPDPAASGRVPDKDPPTMPNPTAAMLTIGDEILSGRTRDTNMPHLARALAAAGIDLREARTVPDVAGRDRRGGERAPRALRPRLHLRRASGRRTTTSPRTPSPRPSASASTCAPTRAPILATNYADPETELNAARLRMARVPDGATLIDNPVSKAPGFSSGNVHVMAGVPAVFEAMVAGLVPRLTGGTPLLSVSVRAPHPEGLLAGPLGALAAAHPAVAIGCYPFNHGGVFGANVVLRATDPDALAAAERGLAAVLDGLAGGGG